MKVLYVLIALLVVAISYFILLGFISRSAQPPGLVGGQLAPCGTKPNSVCSENDPDTAHYVAPVNSELNSLQSIVPLIEQLGGGQITVKERYLSAEFRSALFGFVDDLELRLDVENKLIHLRSASRVGYSDMGVNRKRIVQLRALLEATVQQRATLEVET